MVDERPRLQVDVNRRVGAHIPKDAWDAVVAIVVANRPALHLLGTGTLFEISDCHFVVTASHVIRAAHEHRKTIGISDAVGSFVSVYGDWISSAPD